MQSQAIAVGQLTKKLEIARRPSKSTNARHAQEARSTDNAPDSCDDLRALRKLYGATAIAEISIFASRGKRATSAAARAGGAFLNTLRRPHSFWQNHSCP
jgi:hypothetical protein